MINWLPRLRTKIPESEPELTAPKYVVRTETFEFVDYMGRPIYTDGEGLQVVPFEELWNRPYSQKIIDGLAAMGLVRAVGVNEYYSDGTSKLISSNIGEYHE